MGFVNPLISRYSLPIGAWGCSSSEPLDGLAAFSSFLEYIDSSRLLLEESGIFTKDGLIEFTKAVKQELENLGNAIDDFLQVTVYVSHAPDILLNRVSYRATAIKPEPATLTSSLLLA